MATVKKFLTKWRGGKGSGIELGQCYKVDEKTQTFKDLNGLTRDARWGSWLSTMPKKPVRFTHTPKSELVGFPCTAKGEPAVLRVGPQVETGVGVTLATESQEGGSHYQKPIQPIKYIHMNKLNFCEGNVVKYITRWREKNGLEDLKKAKHYIDLLIELEGLQESKGA